MPDTAPKQDLNGELVKLSQFEGSIVQLGDKFKDIDPAKDMEAARKARQELVSLRTTIDKTRLKLGKGARDFLAEVNATGNKLIDYVVAIEDPIDSKIKEIEAAKEKARQEKREAEEQARLKEARIKAEAEQAEKEKSLALERKRLAKEQAEHQASLAKLKAEREEYERQMRVEAQKLADAQRALKEQQQAEAERTRKEQERLAEQKREQEAEALFISNEKARMAKEKAEEERKARFQEEDRVLKEAQARIAKEEEAARQAEIKTRLAALAPDRKILAKFATALRKVTGNTVAFPSEEGTAAHARACSEVERIAVWLDGWPLNNEIVEKNAMIEETHSRR